MVQEEIANVLEKHGVVLNPNNRQQLYELLATYPDLENLAAAIEARFAAEAAFNKTHVMSYKLRLLHYSIMFHIQESLLQVCFITMAAKVAVR